MKSFGIVLVGAAVAVAQIPANTPACGVSREQRKPIRHAVELVD
jgi:hypothetical protein